MQILVFIRNFQLQNFQSIFYFCNHIPILLALFFYFKKNDYIKTLINIGFLSQIVWILDLLMKLLFDIYLFGFSVYVFEGSNLFGKIIAILIHTTTLIPSLFFTWKISTNRKSFFYAIICLFLMFFLPEYLQILCLILIVCLMPVTLVICK